MLDGRLRVVERRGERPVGRQIERPVEQQVERRVTRHMAYGCTASYLSCGCGGLKTAWPHFAKGVAGTEVIGGAAIKAKKTRTAIEYAET